MTRTLLDPLVALQRAHFAAINQNAAIVAAIGGVSFAAVDRVNGADFPYAVIGEDRLVPDDGECETASEVHSTIRIYSRGVGKLEAKAAAGVIRFLLDKDEGFLVDGFVVNAGHCTSLEVHPHGDDLTTQVEMNFRYLLTPAQA